MMKRIIVFLCILSVVLPVYAYITEISAKAATETSLVAVVDDLAEDQSASFADASVDDDDAEGASGVWSSAISKLRSSWISLLILMLVLIALAVVVPYRRSLGVDHKDFE